MFTSDFVRIKPYGEKFDRKHVIKFLDGDFEKVFDELFGKEDEMNDCEKCETKNQYVFEKSLTEDLGVKIKGVIPVNIYSYISDLKEGKKNINIDLLVPGIDKDDIKVSLKNDNELEIKTLGKKSCECNDGENKECECEDIRYFTKQFMDQTVEQILNIMFFEKKSGFDMDNNRIQYINKDKLETKYKNGLLKITVEMGKEDEVSNIEIG